MELEEDQWSVARLVRESLRLGVKEMWVIDPWDETVTTHTRAGQVCYANGKLEVEVGTDWPSFRCRVDDIFR
jgi:hypothetical protein